MEFNMMTLWEFKPEVIELVIKESLSDLGDVSSQFIQTKCSRVYTLDGGSGRHPRYLIAKGPWFDAQNSAQRLERFVYEAENTVKISAHPFLHRFGKLRYVQGVPFLISAKRDGTLEDVIAGEPISIKDCLAIGIQISRALEYCQQMGIQAHQDLKPANIFIDDLVERFGPTVNFRYLARVADFELSNAYRDLRIPSGSRPYMAPEQHFAERSPEDTDITFDRADTFSFGIVLHELATGGMHPVGERTADIWPGQLENKKKWKGSKPWRQWIDKGAPISWPEGELPANMRNIIKDCLNTNPLERPTLQDVQARLWEALKIVDPVASEGLELCTREWEKHLYDGSDNHWPAGEALLNTLRVSFANR